MADDAGADRALISRELISRGARPAPLRAVRAALLAAALAGACAFAALFTTAAAQDSGATVAGDRGCLVCHTGIEEMHPWAPVTCVQCHGGNAAAAKKEDAHVAARQRAPGDERVLGPQWDLERTRFLDPGNLRVAGETCGPCHSKACADTVRSLHATTAGHLADGLYENGVVAERHPAVSVFNVRDTLPDDAPRPAGAVPFLRQIGAFLAGGDREKVSTHFTDLPRKACMQCHLWSRGRAVRGRAGMDGDYRGEGCTACHVPYADDGIAQTKDPTVDKFEPGHPKEHRMVRTPTTDTCVRCHYGDASIGLSFRGLAQPVPGMPQTPDAPGLHRKRLNGVYYIDDPAATPADVHHQRGMHCADCHTRNDAMGDGFLYRRMEDQVEIGCETCHGTPDGYATGITRKGTKLAHLERREDGWYLKGRVTGKLHRVKQCRDVVKPGSPDYNSAAALAMTPDHGRVACHTCHSAWNPNFFGFHFDRNESFTQLDLLAGTRTPGRVTTQEKVFSTFKQFYVGWDSHGRVAPYMVGFSSMATVHDKDGGVALDQELPVTRAGLSGMTMIHHQTHTTTSRARQCVECHRAPAALGRGTGNFRLAREMVAVGGDAGVRFVVVDRKAPANSAVVSAVPVAGASAVVYMNDRLTGRAQWLFAASASDGLAVIDVSSPGFPRIVSTLEKACVSPEALVVAGSRLYLADGAAGLKVFDVSQPSRPRAIGAADVPAYAIHADGPTLFVAAGTKGLATIDVRDPASPRIVCAGTQTAGATSPPDCRSVATQFQFSRPNPDLLEGPRSKARNLAAVGSQAHGVLLFDVTDPAQPLTLARIPGGATVVPPVTSVALATVFELGSEGGAIPSRERDLLVATLPSGAAGLVVFDVTDPIVPAYVGAAALRPNARAVRIARWYNAPFLQTYALTADPQGIQLVDLTRPATPTVAASVALPLGRALDLEEFPLDRAVDADGKPILDVSHEGARWLDQAEYLRVLGAPLLFDAGAPAPPGGVK